MARRKHGEQRGAGRSADPRSRWHDGLAPETKRSILAVLCFALAAVILLAYWGRAGLLGQVISQAITLAVGRAYFLAPVTLVLIGASLLASLRPRRYASTFVGGGLFLLSSLAVVDLVSGGRAGGWLGFAANWPLERAFDFWAAFIIEGAALLAAVLILANVPLWKPRQAESALERREAGPGVIGKVREAVRGAAAGVAGAIEQREEAAVTGDPVAVSAADRPPAKPYDAPLAVSRRRAKSSYVFPPLDLLDDDRGTPSSGDIRANANIIRRTLLNFGVDVEMGEVSVGPTVTQYTLKPAQGVKLSRIVALQNDLSLSLAAHPIRIEAPIPGKSLVGIEVPNRSIALVGLRSVFGDELFQKSSAPLLFALGRDVAGAPVYANLAKMPHLLVAGSTGSGKSVALHAMITAFLYRNPPEMLRFLIVDPKRVELSVYAGIPHLLAPPITDAKKTIQSLRWAVKEMERRYEALSAAGVRDIASYHEAASRRGGEEAEPMPYLIIAIDELADLMAAFPREVEGSIIRLAQMARAVGIHLAVSTQRPSVEVITGLIKANITSRIAFQVASQVDSRTILDVAGAEKLLGNGDMLFLAGDTAKPRRIQGAFVSEAEVARVAQFIRERNEPPEPAEELFVGGTGRMTDSPWSGDEFGDAGDDPLYEEARQTVIQAGKASASYLQRRLKIGYARAARLLDLLEERGVIGPGEGAKPREVLVKREGAET